MIAMNILYYNWWPRRDRKQNVATTKDDVKATSSVAVTMPPLQLFNITVGLSCWKRN